MKFNIEVELDYIGDDGNLDEAIKDSILNSVTKIVMEKVSKQVDAKVDEIIVNAAEEKAGSIVDKISEDFLTREYTKTDRYGDTIECGLTVKELLKRDFDNFWKEIVDGNGRKDGYGNKKPRIEWKLDTLIEEHSRKFAQTLTNDTENKIKSTMKENLSRTIGTKLVSKLGFDKLLLESNK